MKQFLRKFDKAGNISMYFNFVVITPQGKNLVVLCGKGMTYLQHFLPVLMPMTNNSCNVGISASLITFLISNREAVSILSTAKRLMVEFGLERISICKDFWLHELNVTFHHLLPLVCRCTSFLFIPIREALGFKDQTSNVLFDFHGVWLGKIFLSTLRVILLQVEMLTA